MSPGESHGPVCRAKRALMRSALSTAIRSSKAFFSAAQSSRRMRRSRERVAPRGACWPGVTTTKAASGAAFRPWALGRRTLDATCDGQVDGDLSSQLEFPARIRIAGRRAGFRSNGARPYPRDELVGKALLGRHPHLE